MSGASALSPVHSLHVVTMSKEGCLSASRYGEEALLIVSVYLLGVVDEYWAMREPSQYHEHNPQCDLESDPTPSEAADGGCG